MRKSLIMLGIFALIAPLLFLGCEGSDGSQGPPGQPGTTTVVFAPADQPETCVVCHSETGTDLHELYQELYQNNVIVASNLQTTYTAPNIYTTTVILAKDGAPFDCRTADTSGLYIVVYDNNTNAWDMPNGARLSLTPTGSSSPPGSTAKAYNAGTGQCTITTTFTDNIVDYTAQNALVVFYGADEQVGSLPARIRQVKFPFEALYETQGPGTITYESAANVAGCEKCHSDPYLKHGYIYGQANDNSATDFYACKGCHLDNGEGGHLEWQISVNDPPLWASGAALTPAQEAQYAYETRLMNDVHMSHAMEFPYPQSMSNCIVCHANKLDLILTDSNFVVSTCKSCHPTTGSATYTGGMSGTEPYQKATPGSTTNAPTVELALRTLMGPIHGNMALDGSVVCNTCHYAGNGIGAPVFSQVHTGYYKNVIYYVDPNTGVGTKYSSAITVAIDNASFDNNLLTIQFSAAGTLGGLNAADITPTVLVGLYGWDTKDFIVGPHARDIDDDRNLEYVVGATHPRFTTVTNAGGVWEVVADLSDWSALIASDNVTKVEIGVTPALVNPALGVGDNTVALNAPSKTFDLGANKFVVDEDTGENIYYQGINAIVRVSTGCNECHEALATTFHTNNRGRGGNIVVCRLCHITLSGGSHLEMQSRSIDSYAHAIHSMQVFDINNIDFTDDVYAKHYEEHIEFPYPKHGITDCESCHNKDKYNAPSQYQSMPGLLSASEKRDNQGVYSPVIFPDGLPRNIGDIPEYVTGPGVRACGACHRAHAINEDSAGELEVLFSHWKELGYMYENDEPNDQVLYDTIYGIMVYFGNP